MDEYKMDRAKVLDFFSKTFPMMQYLRVVEEKTTGTPEFCSWELLIEIVYDVDEPKMGISAGQKTFVRGAAVQRWVWSGAEEWNGDLGVSSVRDWKIVREDDYMIALKPSSEGEVVRIF
jgi:hypothetical protein